MILNGIHASLTTPISLNRIAKSHGIPSAATVKEYLEILHASFICFPVVPLDISRKAPFPRRDRKYYFTDPAFLQMLETLFALAPADESRLAEQSAATSIIRHFAEEWSRWGHVQGLNFWRSSSNREVDFVIAHDSGYFGIEVKFQKKVSGWDEMSLSRGIGQGLLVTKDLFEFGMIPKIPLWMFLSLTI
jgi:predicted AAA+ superfamily ATPase